MNQKQKLTVKRTLLIVAGIVLVSIALIALSWVLLRTETTPSPIVGTWSEEYRIDCTTGDSFSAGSAAIQELRLRQDNSFDVTWHPFETYVDYAGEYTYNNNTGELSLHVRKVNYLPDDVVTNGTASVDAEGLLRLEGIYLGTSQHDDDVQVACGHVFTRRS